MKFLFSYNYYIHVLFLFLASNAKCWLIFEGHILHAEVLELDTYKTFFLAEINMLMLKYPLV